MLKLPFKACSDSENAWIENGDGETLFNVDPMIASAEATRIAEYAVHALTHLLQKQEQIRRVAPLGAVGGRPRLYEPRRLLKPKQQRGRPRRVKKPITGE